MAFTNKNLQSHKSGMTFLKGATFFFLGMSLVMFMTKAFEIEPATRNAVQLIQKIIFTTDGDASSTQMVSIDGSGGNASFAGTVSAGTLSGNTICIGNDCQTSRPSGGTVIGGDSVWSTGASSVAYYNLGNVGIGINSPTARLQVSGSVLFKDYLTFSTNAYIYPVIEQDNNGKSLNIYAGGVLDENGGPWVGGSLNLKGGDITNSQGSSGGSVYINGGAGTVSGNIILGNIAGKVGINTSSPTCGIADACGFHVNGRDSYFGGEISVMNGNAGIGYDVGNTSGSGNLSVLNNVGIGTTSPTQKLDVRGNVAVSSNVGIGTTAPTTTLDVRGSAAIGDDINENMLFIVHEDGNEKVIYGRSSGTAKLMVSYNEGLYGYGGGSYTSPRLSILDSNGNVGIGTTTPSAKLTVNGGVKAISLTMDPCSDTTNYPEGTMFYNNTANHYCFCDADTVASDMQSPGTPCF